MRKLSIVFIFFIFISISYVNAQIGEPTPNQFVYEYQRNKLESFFGKNLKIEEKKIVLSESEFFDIGKIHSLKVETLGVVGNTKDSIDICFVLEKNKTDRECLLFRFKRKHVLFSFEDVFQEELKEKFGEDKKMIEKVLERYYTIIGGKKTLQCYVNLQTPWLFGTMTLYFSNWYLIPYNVSIQNPYFDDLGIVSHYKYIWIAESGEKNEIKHCMVQLISDENHAHRVFFIFDKKYNAPIVTSSYFLDGLTSKELQIPEKEKK